MLAGTDHEVQFHAAVADLLDLPELHASRQRVHHFDLTEYDHLMQVAQTAHRVSRLLRADARTSARAGLLHDLGAHWFNTVKPVALATRLEEPVGVRHAIRAHTLLPVLPRTREAWAVVAADFITTARECHFIYRRTRAKAAARVRTRLTLPAPRALRALPVIPALQAVPVAPVRVRLAPAISGSHRAVLARLAADRRLRAGLAPLRPGSVARAARITDAAPVAHPHTASQVLGQVALNTGIGVLAVH